MVPFTLISTMFAHTSTISFIRNHRCPSSSILPWRFQGSISNKMTSFRKPSINHHKTSEESLIDSCNSGRYPSVGGCEYSRLVVLILDNTVIKYTLAAAHPRYWTQSPKITYDHPGPRESRAALTLLWMKVKSAQIFVTLARRLLRLSGPICRRGSQGPLPHAMFHIQTSSFRVVGNCLSKVCNRMPRGT